MNHVLVTPPPCRTEPGRSAERTTDDDQVDLLDHIDPRSRHFFEEATVLAAYLVGEGRGLASCRSIVTTALMCRTIKAAHERRPCWLSEIESVLEEAGRRIRHHCNSQSVVCRTIESLPANGVSS